jgi:predicted TIM-barrel fold metal-dependent hydrolase
MLGVKIFPAYLGLRANHPELMAVYALCEKNDRRVILSFEDAQPPATPSLLDYFEDLDSIASRFEELRIQVNHGGSIDPFDRDAPRFYEVVRSHSRIWVSTSFLGMVWDDETEYPFPHYLSRLERLRDGVGSDRIMWGTDWPWTEEFMKYPQAVNAIRRHATFFSDQERAAYLGGNALSYLGSLGDQLSNEQNIRAGASG